LYGNDLALRVTERRKFAAKYAAGVEIDCVVQK
jgi:hypothetical protein